ncbi:MAG TPA: glycosyltransferase [Acidimicrobiales bacterium]|jgi:hypothetical protein
MAGTISLSIVVPAFNEAGRLADGIERLDKAIADGAVDPVSTEVVLVDDGSTDGTASVAADLLAHLPHTQIVRSERNRGKGGAIRLGVGRAQGLSVAFTDADMAIDPDQFPLLVEALYTAHVAIGARTLKGSRAEGDSTRRKVMGRVFNRLVNGLTGLELGDTQCGFKGFRSSVARLLFHCTGIDGFAFDVEVLYVARQLGLTIAQVPVRWRNISGTRVRPLVDPVAMALDIVGGWARRRAPTPLPAFTVGPARGTRVGADDLYDDLVRRVVDTVGPSLPVLTTPGEGATVLMPLASAQELARIRAALGDLELPDGSPVAIRQVSVPFAALRARAPLGLAAPSPAWRP